MAASTQSSAVACKRCGCPIAVKSMERPVEEFAVTCSKCGCRGVYRRTELKPLASR